jgi:UDP-galactose transporter B1
MRYRIFFVAGGIFVFYFIFGLLQEKVLKGAYGEEKEKFTFIMSLLFVQTTVIYLYSILLQRVHPVPGEDTTPTYYYCSCALTYLLAMASSFMSLQWVSYPTQVIAKSGKPIPVLIMGTLIGNKVFPARKYFFVVLIVFGVAMFLYKDGGKSTVVDATKGSGMGVGELLLISSLTMDGLTNALQERMMSQFNPDSNQLMRMINKWSMVFLGASIVYTGEVYQFLSFIQRHPSVIWQIAVLAVTSALGQFFIYKCVCEFGTLTCSIVTTTRKFFTVLASILLFGNALLLRQWVAVVCVFTGLFLDSYFGKTAKRHK